MERELPDQFIYHDWFNLELLFTKAFIECKFIDGEKYNIISTKLETINYELVTSMLEINDVSIEKYYFMYKINGIFTTTGIDSYHFVSSFTLDDVMISSLKILLYGPDFTKI
jgi:hypothetical protein